MTRNAPLFLALAAVAGAPLAAQTTPGSDETDPVRLEAFTVVGSRMESTDRNTPSPIVRIDQIDLKDMGFSNLGDVVRNLPFNSGSTIGVEGASTGFGAGTSSINLRGLGNNNTLVLINGRRAAPAGGSAFNGLQTVFDFNSVPASLVESMQILKDAGSGIYGSDAVAGVVAIELVKKFDGTQVSFSVGNSTEVSSPSFSANLIHGWNTDRHSLVVAIDARWQERTKYRDRPFSRTGDQRAHGGLDWRSSTSFPARYAVAGTFFSAPTPLTNPVRYLGGTGTVYAVGPGNEGLYDFNQIEDMFPEAQTRGFYARWMREGPETVQPFAEFSFRQNITEYEAAPVVMRSPIEQGDGPDGVINLPQHNPYNPEAWLYREYGIDDPSQQDVNQDLRWRMAELGSRVFDNRSDYLRALAGLAGNLPEHRLRWEAAVLYSRSDAAFTTKNMTSDALLQQALNGTLPGLAGAFANPFGPSDPGVIDAIRVENTNDSSFATLSADAFVTGRAWDLPTGTVRYAFGTEVRREEIDDQKSALSAAGQLVGGSDGAPFNASREVYALFAEAAVPLLPQLELRGAARFEYYSDFGDTTKPKISLAWHPLPRLTLRASYGGAFLAPNLPYLHTPRLTTYSEALFDPKRPADPPTQMEVHTGGNPDLQPEETKVYSAGFLWEARPSDKLGLSLEGSWFQFDQKNLLQSRDAAFLIANEEDPAFAGRVIRAAPAQAEPIGRILYVETYYRNEASQRYQGYDFDVAYSLHPVGIGRWRASVSCTYIDTLTYAGTSEFAGTYGNPQVSGNAGLSWSTGNWAASTFVTYKGHYLQRYPNPGYIEQDTRVNLTLSHSNVFGWQVTLGVRNLFNVEPPFDLSRAEGYNIGVNSGESRYVTLTLTKRL